MNKKIKHYKAGLWAETCAGMYLRFKGYSILAQRFKTPVGEIDIIAKRGGNLVFVEVKKRGMLADALEAVSIKNQERVRRAASWWLQSHATLADKCDIRFDAVAIAPYCKIQHIINAF